MIDTGEIKEGLHVGGQLRRLTVLMCNPIFMSYTVYNGPQWACWGVAAWYASE